jgi:predicted ester cyclase
MRMTILAAIVLALAVAVFFWLRHGSGEEGEPKNDPTEVVSGKNSNEKDAWTVWHEHSAKKIFSRVSDDAIWEFMADPGQPGEDQGRSAVLELFEEEFEKPFPDEKVIFMRRFVFEQPLIIDELWTAGIHQGTYSGFKPTMKRVGARALWFRWYRDGKLYKIVTYSDRVTTILRQIGHLPPSAGVVPEVPPLPKHPDSFDVIEGEGDPKRIEAVRAAYAAFAKPDKSAVKALYTAETLFRDVAENIEIKGVDKHLEQMAVMEKAFPTTVAEVAQAFAVGDYVITMVVWKGTHDGPLGKLKPTGRPVEIKQAQVFRFEGDKVVDVSTYSSTLDFIRQIDPLILGAFSPTPRVAPTMPGSDAQGFTGPTKPGGKPPEKKTAPPVVPLGATVGSADASPSPPGSEGGKVAKDEPAAGGGTDSGQPPPKEGAEKATEGKATEQKPPQPGTQPEKAPEKAPAKAPEGAPEKAPEKAPEGAPEKAPAKAPEKAPEKAPAPAEAQPDKAPGAAPSEKRSPTTGRSSP